MMLIIKVITHSDSSCKLRTISSLDAAFFVFVYLFFF